MEPAKIDWKRIDSRFVEDRVYEHINAPKWFDFLAIQDSTFDDDAWFCRPDCNHPKTAEDFFKNTPPPIKLAARSANGGQSGSRPLGERNQGDAKLKRRGQIQSTLNEDSENQNPNLITPPNHTTRSLKAAIKSSSEKKKSTDDMICQSDEMPRLKATLSARNLFGGRDILSHITDFCNELKKLASRSRETETENNENLSENKSEKEVSGRVLGELDSKVTQTQAQKERKPLLEMGKEKLEGMEKGSGKEKLRRKKKNDEAENIPVSLNLENVRHKAEERVVQIRTNPPSPQCFSAPHASMLATPSKAASRSRFMERGILQELKQNKETKKEEMSTEKPASVVPVTTPIIDGRQARALDVFWFLKPCTLSE